MIHMDRRSDNLVIYNDQKFLEDYGSFISAKCAVDTYYKDESKTQIEWSNVTADLSLCNGNDILHIDLATYDEKNRNEAVEKIDKIIEVFVNFREALIVANARQKEIETIMKEQTTFEEVVK